MEDLWKDFQLSSLRENPSTKSTTSICQDFLSPGPGRTLQRDHDDHSARVRFFINSPLDSLAMDPSFSSPCACSTSKNKRLFVDQPKNDDSETDPRHKRMMKNRESASRSRARRQAYTSELERKVAQLMEENAQLRKHLEKSVLCGPAEIPKKRTHSRSLTAPF